MPSTPSASDQVNWFRNSSPYINAHRGRTFVVLLGGEVLDTPRLPTLVHDLALLNALGVKLVLVHGARPQISQRLEAAGLESRFEHHTRITDSNALEAVMAAVGALRLKLEGLFSMGLANSPMHNAAIQPEGLPREPCEKRPVVTDQGESGLGGREMRLQPFDRFDVQMVGRLVEQHQIGLGSQQTGQRRAAPFTARGRDRVDLRVDLQPIHRAFGAPAVVFGQIRRRIVAERCKAARIRLLRQIGDMAAGLHEPGAAIGLDLTGCNLQERRLSRPVASDNADPLAR